MANDELLKTDIVIFTCSSVEYVTEKAHSNSTQKGVHSGTSTYILMESNLLKFDICIIMPYIVLHAIHVRKD